MGNLLDYFQNPYGWAGGIFGGSHNEHGGGVDAEADVGGGVMHPTSNNNDVLGGLVGGFGGPMTWNGAGFGGVAGGTLTDDDGGYAGGHAGAGAGAGYASFNSNGRSGHSAAGGVVAPVGVHAGNDAVQAEASTNLYRAAGGSAYQTEHGYGASGTYTPLGAADTNVSVDTEYGSASAHADNMYLGQTRLDGSVNNDNGNYTGELSMRQGMGIEGYRGNMSTPLGNTSANVGSAHYGPAANVGGGYNTNTGVANVHGGYSDGVTVNNAGVGFSTPGGAYSENLSAQSIRYGNSGNFDFNSGPNGVTATGSANYGGVNVQGINHSREIDGVGSMNQSLGEFSTDTQISDVEFASNGSQTRGQASWDGGGMRFKNYNNQTTIGSGPNQVNLNASAGSVGSTNSVTKGFLEANYGDPSNPSLRAGAQDVSIGGWSGTDLKVGATGPGNSSANASLGSFNQGFTMHNSQATLDRTGLHASAENIRNDSLTLQNINANANIGNGALQYNAHAGEIATNHLALDGARASIDRNGVGAHVDSANYSAVYLNDVNVNQNIGNGAYQSHVGLGEGGYNMFTGRNIDASLNTSGLSASGDDLRYSYLRGSNITLGQSIGDGAAGYDSRIGSASVGGIGADHVDYNTNLMNTNLSARNLNAHGLQSTDVNARANIGSAEYRAHADRVDLANLTVGQFDGHSRNFGTQGDVNLSNTSLDVVNVQGANANLNVGGRQIAGAGGDARLGGNVENANANWNLMNGTANANITNANYGAQLSNAHVNVLGTNYAVPNMGANVHANAAARADVRQGTASANMNLAGSSVNFGGTTLTAGEWAQASGDVNVRQGAVNANVGGANGVGVNANLAQGNLDVNLFGRNIDVDGGIRQGATAVSNGAAYVRDGASNLASRAWNSLPSIW